MVEGIHFTTEVCDDWKALFQKISSSNNEYHHLAKRVLDSQTASQLESKLWIINELMNALEERKLKIFKDPYLNMKETVDELFRPKNIVLLGGWYAQFSVELLITHLKPDFIQNYEIDRDAKNISLRFNQRYKDKDKYSCDVKDIMWEKFVEREEERIIYDLIINTSCEHMFPMTRFYSLNKFKNYPLYVLQSTDDDQYDDHINCVSSLDEFIEQAKITEVLYSGERKLSNGMKRFMVIGYPSKDAYRNDDVID